MSAALAVEAGYRRPYDKLPSPSVRLTGPIDGFMPEIPTQQGSDEWLALRMGLLTASEIDQWLCLDGSPRRGDTPHSYLCRKVAERWLGRPLDTKPNWNMEQGSVLEDEARPLYAARVKKDVKRPGLLVSEDGLLAASPDFMLPDLGGEIKCPRAHTMAKWLLDRWRVPPEHLLQCHAGMYASGLDRWVFVAYCRGFPWLEIVVERDEQMMAAIRQGAEAFKKTMDGAWEALKFANGGREPVRPEHDESHIF